MPFHTKKNPKQTFLFLNFDCAQDYLFFKCERIASDVPARPTVFDL